MRLLYAVLAAMSAAAIILWAFRESLGPWAGAWMPNVGTSALAILITVAVVNRIVEHRERERKRPRVERALYDIGLDLRLLVSTLFSDYAFTHAATYSTPPLGTLAAIGHWVEGIPTADRPEWKGADADMPIALGRAFEFGRRLTEVRESDRDVLEPDLVAAMDDCTLAIQRALTVYRLGEGQHEDRIDEVAFSSFGQALRRFVPVFERYDDRWKEMPKLTADAADESHSHVVRED
jgi:hypothetical protein